MHLKFCKDGKIRYVISTTIKNAGKDRNTLCVWLCTHIHKYLLILSIKCITHKRQFQDIPLRGLFKENIWER